MSFRGSFTQCVEAMGILFVQDRYDFLHCMHNPKGKYYTVYSPVELEAKIGKPSDDGDRLVLSITRKEMRIICDNRQEDLFKSSQSG